MNTDDILTALQRTISQEEAATDLTSRSLEGTDKETEAAAAIENVNQPDAVQMVREWNFQVEPGELRQVEGKEKTTAYT